ncbi:hypothetical protein LTS15_009374 [Exophiala xenobiotica]|nr:hypothetical protein LTS15_009374 [Exophiala xenobiotica]
MPLHLLGKKSWNVYNPGNIERVRQDEAEAKRLEEEREAQHRDDQAQERLRLLRGEGPVTRQPESQTESFSSRRSNNKRKLPGEDDTDRDLRLALSTQSTQSTQSTSTTRVKNDDPIVDSKGNISLIPVPESSTSHKKPRLDEDPYAVYLSHAAGRGKNNKEKPWYSDPGAVFQPSWGDDSPRRTDREAARVTANDPLAAMKKGVKRLREAEKHRTEWMEQRERDLQEVEELARLKRRRDKGERRRRRHEVEDDVPDDLDNFNLDEGYAKPQALENEHAHRHKHRHHHRHRRHHHEHRESQASMRG